MAKPRKSTLDAWIDAFLSWSFADREGALQLLNISHRAATQVEKRFGPQPEQLEQGVLDEMPKLQ
jgi:hypothetical protein